MDKSPTAETEIVKTTHQLPSLEKDTRYQRVLQILDRLRRRAFQASLFAGLGRLMVFCLASLSVRCLLDHWLEFGWGARVALLSIDLILISWICWRYLIRPLMVRFERESAALRLQSHAPDLRSQVIATIQLVPKADAAKAPYSLVERLLDQTAAALARTDWKDAIPLKSSSRWLMGAAALALALIGWAYFFPHASSTLVARYFLSTRPPIQDTQITVLSGDMKVPRGARVELEAELSGVVPDEVGFFLDEGSGSSEQVRVRAEPSAQNRFVLPVDNLQDGFVYSVAGGDAISPEFTVDVLEAPVVEELVFAMRPPAYTGVAPYEVPASELRIIEGSQVSLRGRASMPQVEATALLSQRVSGNRAAETEGLSKQELTVDHLQIAGDLGVLASELTTIAVALVSDDGIESVDNTRHAIKWELDAPPEIEIETAPENESTLATGRPATVRGQVADDYAVSTLRFVWSLADGERSDSLAVPVDESGRFNLRFVVGQRPPAGKSAWLKSTPGEVINWRLEAEDNSRLPRGPQVTKTVVQRHAVVTPEEKIAELLDQIGENVSTIEEARERQEAAGKRLRELMDAGNVD